ncbi:MAG: tRNA lysidine(34) synthetase TilS [Actinomycetes bacterium]|jgi:tRNA(Ile)-lysidine synthase|nr:tRNA lysidine(34) synthetase TilS [Actinomycetes bacterium]
METDVWTYIERHALFDGNTPLVLLCSGGGDSTALLRLLRSRLNPDHCVVLHVNHLLRGADSDADEAFVRELCAELGLPLEVRRIDVEQVAANNGGQNLEDAGRTVRYEAAQELVDSVFPEQEGRIVTAHTLDDRVETFFIRAIYGAGMDALASIAPRRGNIVRPLLSVTRRELRDWLRAGEYGWREDASNQDVERTRAFVRARIVPAAEELRGNFRRNLERTMDLLRDDGQLLSDMARRFASDFTLQCDPGRLLEMDARLLSTLDQVMARRTLREAIIATFPQASRLEAFHIEALSCALGEKRYTRDLSGGLRATIKCDTLVVTRISS